MPNTIRPPRALVVGGTGHYGHHIVHSLAQHGAAVRVLSRNAASARSLLGEEAEIVAGDITAEAARRAALQDVDALMVCGLAWIVPNLICMWIPETLLVPLGVGWPGWLEILRIMVIPPLWQTALVSVGLHITHQVGWLRAVLIGLLSVAVFFIMFLAFMR